MKQLLLVKCLPAALGTNSSPSDTLSTLRTYLVEERLLEPTAAIEEFLPRLRRLVVAPYPLPLSIALPLLPYVQEVYIDRSVVDPNERVEVVHDVKAALGEHCAKEKKYYGQQTLQHCFNIPVDCYALAIVTTVFADNAKGRDNLHGNGLLWPQLHEVTDERLLLESCLGEQPRGEEVEYWDDDAAARIQVRALKEVRARLQQAKVQVSAVEVPEFTPLGLDTSATQESLSSLSASCNSLLSTLTALKSRLSP